MIAQANSLHIPLADRSVHCIITSPPFYNLRRYSCGDDQIGLEPTPAAFVEALRQFGREAHRVLTDTGLFFINLGDSYVNNPGNGRGGGSTIEGGKPHLSGRDKTSGGLPAKSLIGVPWKVAFALQDDGWIIRNELIWHKLNPMPSSAQDRFTVAHETIFMLAKQPRYWFDMEAIKEPCADDDDRPRSFRNGDDSIMRRDNGREYESNGTRQPRDVLSLASQPFPGAHFATWPPALVTPMLLAACPPSICSQCGAPHMRIVEKEQIAHDGKTSSGYEFGSSANRLAMLRQAARANGAEYSNKSLSIGWCPTCQHNAPTVAGICLDPFAGSGTTGMVAREHARRFIGLDLSANYLATFAAPRAEQKTTVAALRAERKRLATGEGEPLETLTADDPRQMSIFANGGGR
jgi:site-specific DNA-methyltransferase (cytosine-N4-specific)